MPAPPPENRAVALAWRVAAVAAVAPALAVWTARVTDPDFAWLPFSDRDLLRAHELGTTPQIEGAEISHGSGVRVPGGALYALLRALEQLGPAPDAVWRATALLDALAAVILGGFVARRHGRVAGALALGLAATATATASTLTSLWNPSLLPLFATAAWIALLAVVETGWAPALAGLLLAGAIAAQLHLSAVPLVLAAVVVAAAARPRGLGRWLALGGLLAVGAYLPFLVVDAVDGFRRLGALGAVSPARGAAGPAIAGALDLLRGPRAPTVPSRVVPSALLAGAKGVVVALDAALLLGALDLLRRRDPGGRIARAVLPPALAVALAAVGSGFDPAKPGTGRHLLVAVPGLAVLGALGLAAAARRLPSPASIALAGLVTVGFAGRGTALVLAHRDQSTGPLAWGTLQERLHAVEDTAHVDVFGMLDHTAFVADGPWRAAVPYAYPARLARAPLGALRTPPCLAILAQGRGGAPAAPEDALRRAFPWARIRSSLPLGALSDGSRVVAWSPEGPCPTSFGNPWIAEANDAWASLPPGPPLTASALPGTSDWPTRRLVTVPVEGGRRTITLLVELGGDGGLVVAVDAVPLRGDSAGFFPSGPLLDVRVDLVAPGGSRSIPIAPVLGPAGIVTPIRTSWSPDAPLPDTEATLRFRSGSDGPEVAVPLGRVTPPPPPRSP